MKYQDILALNKTMEMTLEGKKYSVGILSNIIVNQLKEIFEYYLRCEKINVSCNIGNYDNIIQDVGEFKDKKLVIIFWEIANIIDGLQYKVELLNNKEIKDLVDRIKGELDYLFNTLKETSHILINKFSSLIFNYTSQERNNLDIITEELNSYLMKV